MIPLWPKNTLYIISMFLMLLNFVMIQYIVVYIPQMLENNMNVLWLLNNISIRPYWLMILWSSFKSLMLSFSLVVVLIKTGMLKSSTRNSPGSFPFSQFLLHTFWRSVVWGTHTEVALLSWCFNPFFSHSVMSLSALYFSLLQNLLCLILGSYFCFFWLVCMIHILYSLFLYYVYHLNNWR